MESLHHALRSFEPWLTEYLANAAWQIPLLAAVAALSLRLTRPSPLARHRVWLAVMLGAVLVPVPRMPSTPSAAATRSAQPETVSTPSSALSPIATSEFSSSAPLLDITAIPQSRLTLWTARTVSTWERTEAFAQQVRNPHLKARTMDQLMALFAVLLLLGTFRLMHGIYAARRLVRRATPVILEPHIARELDRAGALMAVAVPPVRVSAETRSPAVVGVRRVFLLLPKNYATYSPQELRAVFTHELAHVKRRDYLLNILCHIAELPVTWHPISHLVQAQVRHTRELICDRMAAEHEGILPYTRSLLSLAGAIQPAPSAPGHALEFGGTGTMKERVMQLLEPKANLSAPVRALRVAAGAAVLSVAFAATFVLHVHPALAQDAPPPPPIPAAPATPVIAAPPAPAVPAIPPAPPAAIAPKPPTDEPPVPPAEPAVPPTPSAAIPPAPPLAYTVIHDDGNPNDWMTMDHGKLRKMTPAERAKAMESMAKARKQMEEAQRSISRIDIQRSMADAQRGVDEASRAMNDPKIKAEIEHAQKEMQQARIDGRMNAQLNGPEHEKQMEEMHRQLADAQRQIVIAQAHIHDGDIDRQIEMAKLQAGNPEIRRKALESAIQSLQAEQARLQKELAAVPPAGAAPTAPPNR